MDTFSHREFSFTLADDVYVRYQSFDSRDALEEGIRKATPYKIDIGAIFSVKVSLWYMFYTDIHVYVCVDTFNVSVVPQTQQSCGRFLEYSWDFVVKKHSRLYTKAQ